jgi:PAS domain S-box-containing protein
MPKGKKIVFAENDRLVREAMCEVLRSKGFEVIAAEDGLEGLLSIRKERPDYVILDIVMPKLDGGRVCWLIRQDPALRDTAVIAFSSLSAQDYQRFPELSADAYVAKGTIAASTQCILEAIEYVDKKGQGDEGFQGGIYGYKGQRPRQLVGEMLQEKQRQANLFRALGGNVLELDQKGRILMANAGACQLLGKKEPHAIGESLSSFCLERDRKVVDELLVEIAKTVQPQEFHAEVQVVGQPMRLRLSPIIANNESNGVLVLIESIPPKGHASRRG